MVNLVILCGGVSPEHEISIRSTKNILAALDRDKYNFHVIGISKSGEWFLLDEDAIDKSIEGGNVLVKITPGKRDWLSTDDENIGPVDVVFPVLHGPNGEDGSIQGLLQNLGTPFVGPGVLSSSIAMDKDVCKSLLKNCNVLVANWISLRSDDEIPAYSIVSGKLGNILFVKPANMGSSVGVSRVTNENEWKDAVAEAFKYDSKILVEECLIGRELECAVLGNANPKASTVGEVKSGEVYSFDEKYASTSSAEIHIPADVSSDELQVLQSTALTSYKALGCEGLSRIDMFLTSEKKVYVNEVNTIPGFTSISMYPKLWEESGVNYSDLLDELITLGLQRGTVNF